MKRRDAIFAAVLLASLAASVLVLRRLDQIRAGAPLEETLYIPSPRILKRMSLGYDGLLANIYWTRAVQYFGRNVIDNQPRRDLLAPLLDITTQLDPQLIVAYQFGAIFLAQPPPIGAGQPKEAAALVERGIRENPGEWRLYYELGWLQLERKDYVAASQVFQRGSQVPGAPPAMAVLAAVSAHSGAEPGTARFLWVQIYNTTQDKSIRAHALKRLQALQADEEVAKLESAVEAYRQKFGHIPSSWSDLFSTGWRGRLVDPIGNYYVLTADGRVEVRDTRRLPFTTRGLPPGQAPHLMWMTPQQRQAAADASARREGMPQ